MTTHDALNCTDCIGMEVQKSNTFERESQNNLAGSGGCHRQDGTLTLSLKTKESASRYTVKNATHTRDSKYELLVI